MFPHRLRIVVLSLLLSFVAGTCFAGVIYYVKPNGNNSNNGRSWSSPKRSVTGAFAAAVAGDQVWVAKGTYYGRITLKDGVALYGGFAGTEIGLSQRLAFPRPASDTNASVLDGSKLGCVVESPQGATNSTRIDGFTITNGVGTIPVNPPYGRGGGIYCKSSSTTICNNLITGNSITCAGFSAQGCGIYLESSSAVITNNIITGNTITTSGFSGTGSGAGIYCDGSSVTITGNTVSNNTSGFGAAIGCSYSSGTISNNFITGNEGGGIDLSGSSVTVTGNTVSGNSSGCGIYCYGGSPIISRNHVNGNKGIQDGGGIGVDSSSAKIADNTILGNSSFYGGGIFCKADSADISNNLISGNWADSGGGFYFSSTSVVTSNNVISGNSAKYGGGIYSIWGTPKIYNSTIIGNCAQSGGAGYLYSSSATFANDILAYNSSGICGNGSSSVPSLSNNCIYNPGANATEYPAGATDKTVNPKLESIPYGKVHLLPGSPCIDSGSDSVVQPAWKDLDGQARKQGTHVDIGADESDGTSRSYTQPVIRVSPTGNDSNNGSSWTLAKKTVQAGIDATGLSGGEVWVKAGVYNERITLHSYVYLFGGFAGTETSRTQRNWKANASIIDGQKGGSVVTINTGHRASAIDGFTVRNGSGRQRSENSYRYLEGGGIYCKTASPGILNNTITGNVLNDAAADCCGGGLYIDSGSPTVSFNIISANTVSLWNSLGGGGGIYSSPSASPSITNNLIQLNSVSHNTGTEFAGGGGVYLKSATGAFADNIITANTTTNYGGGVYSDSTMLVANNTIVGNSATLGGGGFGTIFGYGKLVNNIIAFNSSGVFGRYDNSMSPTNNCVFGNTSYNYSNVQAGAGNISVDPMFVNRAGGNYHLQASSPCVNRGDDTVLQSGWTDMDGETRKSGSHVEIGADEIIATEPINISLIPSNGFLPAGDKCVLSAKYSDPDGAANISQCYLLINTSFNGAKAMFLRYDANLNRIYVRNAANTAWSAGYAPGTNIVLSTSYGSVYVKETTVASSGKELTVNWKVALLSIKAGTTCGGWMSVADDGGLVDNYEQKGTFTLRRPPVNVSLTAPATLNINTKQTISATYSDPDGYINLAYCHVLINTVLSAANGVCVRYDANSKKLYLRDSLNISWGTGSLIGSDAVLQNNSCKLYCKETTVSQSRTNLVVNWKLEMKSPMAGKNCSGWLQVYDDQLLFDDWESKASLSVR